MAGIRRSVMTRSGGVRRPSMRVTAAAPSGALRTSYPAIVSVRAVMRRTGSVSSTTTTTGRDGSGPPSCRGRQHVLRPDPSVRGALLAAAEDEMPVVQDTRANGPARSQSPAVIFSVPDQLVGDRAGDRLGRHPHVHRNERVPRGVLVSQPCLSQPHETTLPGSYTGA